MHLKCRLLKSSAANNCLALLMNYVYRSKHRGPRTDWSYRSSLTWVYTVCYRGFLNISADGIADDLCAIGALRDKFVLLSCVSLSVYGLSCFFFYKQLDGLVCNLYVWYFLITLACFIFGKLISFIWQTSWYVRLILSYLLHIVLGMMLENILFFVELWPWRSMRNPHTCRKLDKWMHRRRTWSHCKYWLIFAIDQLFLANQMRLSKIALHTG